MRTHGRERERERSIANFQIDTRMEHNYTTIYLIAVCAAVRTRAHKEKESERSPGRLLLTFQTEDLTLEALVIQTLPYTPKI